MIIVLMGPAGSGKSTVGRALAAATRWPFHDADDLHPAANVEKIRRGVPLDDRDRDPWLARIHDVLLGVSSRGENAVLACSALRARYRERITAGIAEVHWVLLQADPHVLRDRLNRRPGHFAGPAILDSQLSALEPPPDALLVGTARPVSEIVAQICRAFELACRQDL